MTSTIDAVYLEALEKVRHATDLDSSDRQHDAFVSYLTAVNYIIPSLIADTSRGPQHFSNQKERQLIRLGLQCFERLGDLFDSIAQQPEHSTPANSGNAATRQAKVTRPFTPLEKAFEENRKLQEAYRTRATQLVPSADKTAMVLSLHRKAALNLTAACEKEHQIRISEDEASRPRWGSNDRHRTLIDQVRAFDKREVRILASRQKVNSGNVATFVTSVLSVDGHPLHNMLFRYQHSVREQIVQSLASNGDTDQLAKSVKTSFNELTSAFQACYPSLTFLSESLSEQLEAHFFTPLWEALVTLTRRAMQEQHSGLEATLHQLRGQPPSVLDVDEHFASCIQSPELMVALGRAFRTVKEGRYPRVKLRSLVGAYQLLVEYLGDSEVGGDDLLPIQCWLMSQLVDADLLDELETAGKLLPEGALLGEGGYCLSTALVAMGYLSHLELKGDFMKE